MTDAEQLLVCVQALEHAIAGRHPALMTAAAVEVNNAIFQIWGASLCDQYTARRRAAASLEKDAGGE